MNQPVENLHSFKANIVICGFEGRCSVGTRLASGRWIPNSTISQSSVQPRAVRELTGDILKGKGLRIAVVPFRSTPACLSGFLC